MVLSLSSISVLAYFPCRHACHATNYVPEHVICIGGNVGSISFPDQGLHISLLLRESES